MKSISILLVLLVLASSAFAQDAPQAFLGARLIPVNGPEIPSGVLIVHRGKIVAVGALGGVTIPADAQRHDLSGKIVMPGLIDTHSHIGEVEGGDSSAPIQPDVRVLDSVNALDTRIQKAQAGGITTANIMSGSGHLLSGRRTDSLSETA